LRLTCTVTRLPPAAASCQLHTPPSAPCPPPTRPFVQILFANRPEVLILPSKTKKHNMKVLFIGGTGNISSAVSRLAVARGIDLYHLNRGTSGVTIPGVKNITGDISKPETLKGELNK